jgi:hypothetical protein
MNLALAQARAGTLARWRAILDVAFTAAVEARLKFKLSLEERHPADKAIWSHDNMHCTLVRPVVEPSDVFDEEALPGFEVRFDDGTQITAFKEELTDTDGRFAPMSEIVCRGFAAARDLGYAGPTHLLREAPIEHLSAFVEVTTRPAPEPQAQPAARAIAVARQELIDALAADQADSYISDIKGRHWLTARFIEGFVGFAQMSIQKLLQTAVDANIAERHESAVATLEAAIAVGGSHVTEVRETVLQFTVLHDDDHDLSDRKLGDLADECDLGAYIGGELKRVSTTPLTRAQAEHRATALGADATFFFPDNALRSEDEPSAGGTP